VLIDALVEDSISTTVLAGFSATELAHDDASLRNPHLLQCQILAILMQVVGSLKDWSTFRQHAFEPCLTTFVEDAKSRYTQDVFEGCIRSGHTIPPEADPVPYINMLGVLRTMHSTYVALSMFVIA